MTRTLEEIWPPYGLVVESGDLRMTALREADVPEVLDVVAGGIHDPSWTPFAFPWTDAPAEEIPANYMRFFASTLARTQGGGASIELVVRRAGRVVGMQAMNGADVAGSRRMETGSGPGRAPRDADHRRLLRAAPRRVRARRRPGADHGRRRAAALPGRDVTLPEAVLLRTAIARRGPT